MRRAVRGASGSGGRDEISAINLCKAFVQAQREYALANPNAKRVGVYAQRFLSSEGKKDGLYWPAKAGELASPFGPLRRRLDPMHRPSFWRAQRVQNLMGSRAGAGVRFRTSRNHA